ncbi:hypothetical protein MA16_Dca018641 [Dendrobium catenatum]|uniref:Uncharacterized protein n=1 Tax=Dendrobium catenatum TaxID=906689 RepID=A0A2I0W5U3_9ASPA|nr:hypothetical protein MA16_Dca018641 [Dendrobium catenatum]
MQMSSATIPRYSSSPSLFYSASRKGIRNQPIVVDDYPPLELSLRWRDLPPEYLLLELPLRWRDPPSLQYQIRDSPPFQRPLPDLQIPYASPSKQTRILDLLQLDSAPIDTSLRVGYSPNPSVTRVFRPPELSNLYDGILRPDIQPDPAATTSPLLAAQPLHPKRTAPKSSLTTPALQRDFSLGATLLSLPLCCNDSTSDLSLHPTFFEKEAKEVEDGVDKLDRAVAHLPGSTPTTKGSKQADNDGNAITTFGDSEISTTLPGNNLKHGKNSCKSVMTVSDVLESSNLQPEVSEANTRITLSNSVAEASALLIERETIFLR